MMLKQLPNALSLSRLVLIVPFVVFFYQKEYQNAFYIFLISGFTDGLDGWLARYFHCQSVLGSFIDPLADKLLIVSSFISLAWITKLPWWLVGLVFLRDATISFGVLGWYWFIQRSVNFKPTWLSKINTFFQLALVTWCLFELAFFQLAPWVINTLMLLTTITTTASYLDYVWTWGKKAYSTTPASK